MTYNDLHALCAADLSYWRERRLDYSSYLAQLGNLNASKHSLFVFDLKAGNVTVREKPTSIRGHAAHFINSRLPLYEQFFRNVAQRFVPDLELSFALILEDLERGHASVPLLSFQKMRDDNLLLVPELDSLEFSFYDNQSFTDDLDYAAKRPEAIFIGSTTGINPETGTAITNTRAYIDSGIPDRIRAAQYFMGKPGVVFRLPNIAQCDSPETTAYLHSQPWAQGGRVSWKKQYGFRFILSLDGNGATCSRMALALRSQSVLIKYELPYLLWYSRALVPGRHYLPATCDEDVLRYVQAEQEAAAKGECRYRDIAHNASAFYSKYLGKQTQHAYAAVLLNELHYLLRGQCSETLRERLDVPASSFDITAHIANVGDQWCWPESAAGVPGSNAAIEAFTVALNGGPLSNDDLEYQCLHEDEVPGPWVRGGTLCGEKSRAFRLLGFRMRLVGAASHSHVLEYRATFANGCNVDWTSAGSWCADIRRNYLESFEVRLRTAM